MIENYEHYLEAEQDLEVISDILSLSILSSEEYLHCKERISEYLHEKAAKKSNASSSAIDVKDNNTPFIAHRNTGISVVYISN